MKDKTLIGGIVFTVAGILIFVALWFFVLRDQQVVSEPITSAPLANPASGTTLYEITRASEARFSLGEVLRGSPTTVVGITNQVAGQIAANLEDLSTAEMGEVRINARTLQTDNDFRNTAIRTRILFTDEYEYIRFVPQSIVGLPANTAVGDNIAFEVSGELSVRDVSRRVTFAVTAVARSPSLLEGSASTTISRSSFDINIPDVPGVANVDDEVLLEIDFIAEAAP